MYITDRVVRTTDSVLCTTDRVNFKTDSVVRTTDRVNLCNNRQSSTNNRQGNVHNQQSSAYNWQSNVHNRRTQCTMYTTDAVQCTMYTTDAFNRQSTERVVCTTDTVNIYNWQRQSDAYNWQRICLYQSISMNAVNKKHNEKDNEMVQLTKIILKQTARHRHWSKNTPRSFATGVDDIGLPQSVIVKSGNCRSNCGTPITRSLVLSGFISSELWQYHLQISFRSELTAETACVT